MVRKRPHKGRSEQPSAGSQPSHIKQKVYWTGFVHSFFRCRIAVTASRAFARFLFRFNKHFYYCDRVKCCVSMHVSSCFPY